MSDKIIAVRNCSFQNKGDRLMLEAVQRAVVKHYPGVKVAVPFGVGDISSDEMSEIRYGMVEHASSGLKGSIKMLMDAAVKVVPPALFRKFSKYQVYDYAEAMAVFSVSGYSYGDVWGQAKVKHDLKIYRRFKRNGVPIILMPATYGPFSDVVISKMTAKLVETCDLVYARDEKSYNNLMSIVSENARAKIIVAPDYTASVKPESVDENTKDKWCGRACIIPNYRMFDKSPNKKNDYLNFIRACYQKLESVGLKPFFLLHQRFSDIKVIRELDIPECEVFESDDHIRLKSIIASSVVVVSSRLHGVINALSTGVPVFAAGWSYKYKETCEDFGVGFLSCDDVSNAFSDFEQFLDVALKESSCAELKNRILKGRDSVAQRNLVMWENVFRLIDHR